MTTSRQGLKWTDEELDTLERMRSIEGEDFVAIGRALHRDAASCERKTRLMGIVLTPEAKKKVRQRSEDRRRAARIASEELARAIEEKRTQDFASSSLRKEIAAAQQEYATAPPYKGGPW